MSEHRSEGWAVDAVLRKVKDGIGAHDRFFREHAGAIAVCAEAMALAFGAGARLFSFGSGESACDAQHLAVEFAQPVIEKRRRLPALALGDVAVLSAMGNDEDFSLSFARQLAVHARPGDVAVGFSTGGKSRIVARALRGAKELSLLTVGISGRDGGAIREFCDHAFVVECSSVHRVQEAHATLVHLLWDMVHVLLGEEDVL